MTATIATIGHNNPPEATLFDISKEEIDSLFAEAKHWLDGAEVSSQAEADGISKLLSSLREAAKAADERRKAENKPFDDGKAAVQAKYAELIADTKTQKGKAVIAIDACKKALTPWLAKIEAEQRAAAEALRKEAEAKEAAARAAYQAAQASDLEAKEKAEAMIREAKAAEAAAARAEKEKAQVKGGARAVSLRTTYSPRLTDLREAARHYWTKRPDEFADFVTGLAGKDVAAGAREIPGFEIIETKEAV